MCGGGESELGQVTLGYTVCDFFFLQRHCCDLMLFLLVLEFMMYVFR